VRLAIRLVFEVDRCQVQAGGVPHFVVPSRSVTLHGRMKRRGLVGAVSPVVIFSGRFIVMVIAFRTAVQPYPDSSCTNCPIRSFLRSL
jgi:hypothetical protein